MSNPPSHRPSLAYLIKEVGKKPKNMASRHVSQCDLRIKLYNLWKAKPNMHQKLIATVRKSEAFSSQRVETFVKFNYRITQNKNINYESTFRKVFDQKRSSKEGKISRGTMHVSDLWCEGNMHELLGNLPYPKDRIKILEQYQKKAVRIKTVNR